MVSVALCTYNGARFLPGQLESIARQGRPIDELIVCDDGSTDETQQIIRSFAASGSFPVRLEINPERLGPTANFAKAISLCTGGIIFLSDQDDRWYPDKVQTLLRCFEDESVGLAFSNAKIVNEDGSATGRRFWDSIWFDAAEQKRVGRGDAIPVLLRHAIAAGSMLAFRSKYLPLILPIPNLPRSHDVWITLLIASVGRIMAVDEDLIDYRRHASNQIGVAPAGLLGQIRMAKHQVKVNAFQLAADLHEAAYQRLDQWPANETALHLLREKIEHSRIRHQLPCWPKRLGVISREWTRGNYSKYSYGYKSVLQDLFLR